MDHQAVEDLRPMLQGVLPSAGGEILRASAHLIFRQHLKFPAYQAFRWLLILRRVARELVMFRERWRITVWKTMDLYLF